MKNKEIYQFQNWHGQKRKKNYFEGWYFKHQNDAEMVAVIPSFHIDETGKSSCMIQIITSGQSYQVHYEEKDFAVAENGLYLKMGNNIFSQAGMILDIQQENICCQGQIVYGPFTLLDYDIMGPFSLVNFMECNHGVLSLGHDLAGQLNLNGGVIDFSSGIGYIEKDWGTSFPQSYTWVQWNRKNLPKEKQCVMASVAHIPFLGIHFTGFLAVVYVEGKEYRLATYNGAKLKYASSQGIWIQKGDYDLIISDIHGEGQQLQAPQKGKMARQIEERPFCNGKILFTENNVPLLEIESEQISFEYVSQ